MQRCMLFQVPRGLGKQAQRINGMLETVVAEFLRHTCLIVDLVATKIIYGSSGRLLCTSLIPYAEYFNEQHFA